MGVRGQLSLAVMLISEMERNARFSCAKLMLSLNFVEVLQAIFVELRVLVERPFDKEATVVSEILFLKSPCGVGVYSMWAAS